MARGAPLVAAASEEVQRLQQQLQQMEALLRETQRQVAQRQAEGVWRVVSQDKVTPTQNLDHLVAMAST